MPGPVRGLVVPDHHHADLLGKLPAIREPGAGLAVVEIHLLFFYLRQRTIRRAARDLQHARHLGRRHVHQGEQAEVVQQAAQVGDVGRQPFGVGRKMGQGAGQLRGDERARPMLGRVEFRAPPGLKLRADHDAHDQAAYQVSPQHPVHGVGHRSRRRVTPEEGAAGEPDDARGKRGMPLDELGEGRGLGVAAGKRFEQALRVAVQRGQLAQCTDLGTDLFADGRRLTHRCSVPDSLADRSDG